MKMRTKTMPMKPPLLLAVAFAAAGITAAVYAAEPTTTLSGQRAPEYPMSYVPPSVEGIERTLEQVRNVVTERSPMNFFDRTTRQELAEVKEPSDNVSLDHRWGGKFHLGSYPLGVIYSGMLSAADATGDKRYADFVTDRYSFYASHYEQFKSLGDKASNPFRNFYAPHNLDACGAIVASMIEAKRRNLGPDLSPIIQTAVDYVHNKQMRLEDGTFCRPNPFPQSIWLDDAYMSIPLLAQWGAASGDTAYFDDAAKQVEGFYKHLFLPERGLFTHAGNMGNPDDHPTYIWGRANGWFVVATVELLEVLPENHPKRPEIIKILKAHAKGIASVQSGSGLWHQLLDRPDSYLESSCTAMFTYAIAKAVNHGWLDANAYAPVALAGWNGLASKITSDGRVLDTCVGTSYADDYPYYYHRPALDDVHGYGPTLLAGAEMIRLLKNPAVHFSAGRDRPNMVGGRERQ